MVKKNKKNLSFKNWQLITIGILLLLALQISIQVTKARADIRTRKAATDIGQQVEKFIDETKIVPLEIPDGTYKAPKTVKYTRISDKTFQVCEFFYRNNDPSSSKLAMFTNLVVNRSSNFMKNNRPDGRYGTLVVDDLHLAGLECQTVDYYKLR
jgi:hypothetical protein